jgi:hypothetical protein
VRFVILVAAATLSLGTVTDDVFGPVINRGWTFAEESVLLHVGDGFFKVSVEYVFAAEPESEPIALVVAFPNDKTVEEPVLLEAGITCGESPRPLPISMRQDSWRFVLSSPGQARCAVTLSYYQPMTGGSAIYVLRSAQEWGRPLERAVLEVRIPESMTCTISPALEALGARDGMQVFRGSFEEWVPREDLVVHLLEGTITQSTISTNE